MERHRCLGTGDVSAAARKKSKRMNRKSHRKRKNYLGNPQTVKSAAAIGGSCPPELKEIKRGKRETQAATEESTSASLTNGLAILNAAGKDRAGQMRPTRKARMRGLRISSLIFGSNQEYRGMKKRKE